MKKYFTLGALLLATAVPVRSQSGFTAVSATVTDPSGVPYAGGHGSAAFVPSPNATTQALLSGSTFPTDVPIPALDSFGAFTGLALADNNVVSDGHSSPPASTWRFSICSQDGKTCFSTTMTITGATQNISALLKAAAAPLPISSFTQFLGLNNNWTGTNNFAGASNLNGGGALVGTFTGNNTESGIVTNTGTLVPCTMGPGIYIVGPAACSSLQTSINAAVALGGGQVWVISPITILSTVTVGSNSPSHIPVVLKVMRPGVITCSVSGTNTNDCFQLSTGSRIEGDMDPDPTYAQYEIVLGASINVRDVIRPIALDGSTESIGGGNIGIDGGCNNSSSVVSIVNTSETFEGTEWHNVGMTNFCGNGGSGAIGWKIYTVAAATDGAASIDINGGWDIPTNSNLWFDINGTANTAVNINRITFRHHQFRANGTSTATMGKITSGVNGQIKTIGFIDSNFGAATISNQNFLTFNGCYYCYMIGGQFSFQSGANDVGVALGNTANQQNFGDDFQDLGFAGAWANLITDARAPSAGGSAQTMVYNAAGTMVARYSSDDGNTTAARFNIAGWTFDPSKPPAVIVGDTATQTLSNKTLNTPTISAANPTLLGVLGFDGVNALKIGDGTTSQIVADISAKDTTTTHAAFASATGGILTTRAIATGDIPNIPLNQIVSPTGAVATFADGNNPVTVNCAQTTDSQDCWTFGETSAATGGTLTNLLANQAELHAATASGSTATPLEVEQAGITATTGPPLAQFESTWNNASLVGQGIVENVTNTNSAAGSLLLNLRVGNVTQFSADKAGNLAIPSGAAFAWNADTGLSRLAAASIGVGNGTNGSVTGNVTATSFTTATATPAASGVLRVASGDSLGCFRNAANGADKCLVKSGAVSGGISADSLDLTQFGMEKVTGRLMAVGTVTTCAFTSGGGTSPSCAIDTGSTDLEGIITLTAGTTPAALGTITLTFSATYGTNKPPCVYTLSNNGTGAWNARGTIIDQTPSTSSDLFNWDNNGTSLTGASTYKINYWCGAK